MYTMYYIRYMIYIHCIVSYFPVSDWIGSLSFSICGPCRTRGAVSFFSQCPSAGLSSLPAHSKGAAPLGGTTLHGGFQKSG